MKKVLVIGGSGFIGSHLVAKLITAGYRVTVPTRRRERARHLILHPTIDVQQADVHDPAALDALTQGQDAVINLVGVLHSKPGSPFGPQFARAHVELPRKILQAMQNVGVKRLLHMSALGASSNGPSMYARSKAEGEAVVRASSRGYTIFQPSIVFGPEDKFLNTFARMAKVLPLFPLVGAHTKLQPVYVEDVAQAFLHALQDDATIGKTFELAGPRAYTLKELVQFSSFAATGKVRPVVPLPFAVGKLQAAFFELLPGAPLMSRDNVDSLKANNVASQPVAGSLGLAPTSMESIAQQYLRGQHPRTRFNARRGTRNAS